MENVNSTNIETIQSLLCTLLKFKRTFGDSFVVGGSLALYIHGFEHNVHDIDLEYRTEDPIIIAMFKALSSTYESNQLENPAKYSNENGHYRFLFDKHIIDVWVVKEISYKRHVRFNDIRFADIISVFKKKLAMNRSKDYKDFNGYLSQLINLVK